MRDQAVVPEPVFRFRDAWSTESYWPDEYLADALPALEALGWLARAPHAGDRRVITDVLDGLLELDIDESDAFPFGLLWALRSTGCIGEVPGLDAQLLAWRTWEETEHVGDPLPFLPPLSEEDGQRVTPEAFDADPDRLHEITLFQAGGEWQLAVPSWPGSPVVRGDAAEEALAGLIAVIKAAAPERAEGWRELTADEAAVLAGLMGSYDARYPTAPDFQRGAREFEYRKALVALREANYMVLPMPGVR